VRRSRPRRGRLRPRTPTPSDVCDVSLCAPLLVANARRTETVRVLHVPPAVWHKEEFDVVADRAMAWAALHDVPLRPDQGVRFPFDDDVETHPLGVRLGPAGGSDDGCQLDGVDLVASCKAVLALVLVGADGLFDRRAAWTVSRRIVRQEVARQRL